MTETKAQLEESLKETECELKWAEEKIDELENLENKEITKLKDEISKLTPITEFPTVLDFPATSNKQLLEVANGLQGEKSVNVVEFGVNTYIGILNQLGVILKNIVEKRYDV